MPDLSMGRLKLELLCRGARLDPSCRLEDDTRPVKRTRGGLGSGVDMILSGKVWVNVPVEESFAKTSPYVLVRRGDGGYFLRRAVDDVSVDVCPVILPPRPAWYDETTRRGKRVGDIGVMQGTYFAVHPSDLCGFWKTEPKSNCRFCSVGLCHGQTESAEKSVEDVLEAVRLARKHERITFIHFNTGYYDGDRALDVILPYVEAVKKDTGLLVGVQCPPAVDLSKYDALKKRGVDHVSFCFEMFDPWRFAEVCPGKAEVFGRAAESLADDTRLEAVRALAEKHLSGRGNVRAAPKASEDIFPNTDAPLAAGRIPAHGKTAAVTTTSRPHPGQLIFYRALKYAVEKWGKGPVAGEIVAGLEPPERSVQAVEFLAELGAVSTVCVFRPCVGTDYESLPPPDPEAVAPVFARQYEVTVEHGIPHGVAPNILTAMVHTQGESRALSREGHGAWARSGNRRPRVREFCFNAKTAAMRSVYRPLCAWRRKR